MLLTTPHSIMKHTLEDVCVKQTWKFDNQKRKKGDFNFATGVNYGVASFSSWSKSICNLIMGIMRFKGPPTTIASF